MFLKKYLFLHDNRGNLKKMPAQKEQYPRFVDSLWCIYAVSVVSAWNAEFTTYPLDLLKTRLQIQGEQASKLGKAPHRGTLKTAIGIVSEEGVLKLWQGMSAGLVRHVPYSGIRILTYRMVKEHIFEKNSDQKRFPLWQSALCGMIAGSVAQFVASPADLIKIQLQMEGKRKLVGLPPRVNGMVDAFWKSWSAGGVTSLWKGAVPNIQRAALVTLGDISAYDLAKAFLLKHTTIPDSSFLHLLASTCAGLVAVVMATPADVIKSRVMNQPIDEHGRGLLYSGSLDCLRQTLKTESFFALYKGFFPLWMRLGPWSLTFWLSYEQVMKIIGAESW